MQWKDIGKIVGKAAPMIGTVLGGPAGGAIGSLIASALGVEDDPEAVQKALKENPDAFLKLKELELNHKTELEKMQLEYAQSLLTAEQKKLESVNETIRAEMAQNDLYTKRWRPTMGYAVTFTWIITWISIVYVVIFNTSKAQQVIHAFAETTVLWSVALSVLGVYVYQRTKEKQTFAGVKPTGIFDSFKGFKNGQ